MNQTPDQGRDKQPEDGPPPPGTGGDAVQGNPRHRVPGPADPSAPMYSDAARYLDSMWQASSGGPPVAKPNELPTEVVPIQEPPGSAPAAASGPAEGAGGLSDTASVPADTPVFDLGAYAMGGAAASRAADPGPSGVSDVPMDPDAGPAAAADALGHSQGFHGSPDSHGAHGDVPPASPVEHSSRGRKRRAALVWGVVGAVALAGAGLAAVKFLDGGDKAKSAATVKDTSPPPGGPSRAAPSPTPPASSAAPSTGAPSGTGAPSSPGSKPPSGTASAGNKPARVDTDGDGIADDPGATDPGKLASAARTAYNAAKTAMAADGVTMTLTSGKRSYQHQKELWEKEVADTGSTAAARNRVLPPDESSHVDGIAIDINVQAQSWMKSKGPAYGWCQMYANESWHFEFNAKYKTEGCPALKPHP